MEKKAPRASLREVGLDVPKRLHHMHDSGDGNKDEIKHEEKVGVRFFEPDKVLTTCGTAGLRDCGVQAPHVWGVSSCCSGGSVFAWKRRCVCLALDRHAAFARRDDVAAVRALPADSHRETRSGDRRRSSQDGRATQACRVPGAQREARSGWWPGAQRSVRDLVRIRAQRAPPALRTAARAACS